ncbi:hypothetical protein DY000_02012235 [Brassica cretica]|uniref:F-box domain-containing protein n=1 Tax=Brassica cretica TaxID=69181 RepID=A0ABQ7D8N3_BRACR|nr:hypothetical protein DY000_02012235 [Brassica cretica]
MGSGLSLFTNGSSSSPSRERDLLKPGLGDLPESCVALILEKLDPVEICRFSKLNRAFRSASWADFVWESKLPHDYGSILEKILGGFPEKLRKRDIYNFLSRVNSFDDGTKVHPFSQRLSVCFVPERKIHVLIRFFDVFLLLLQKAWVDKRTSDLCLCLSVKGLSVTGIDDRRYWNHIPSDESRFSSVAYLQHVWWFQVDGEIEFPFPAGTYSVFFRLHLGKPGKRCGWKVCNTEQIHGWDIKPVQFQIWTEDGQHSSSQCKLTEPGTWSHYHAGDFVVGKSKSSSTKLKFSMTQIDCTHTKGGLCVDSVIVYPSSCKDRLRRF